MRRRPIQFGALRPAARRRATRLEPLEERRLLADTSFPAFLQWFEGSYETIEQRMADVFQAGYGNVYTPPPGRAEQGNFSVGYDVYDRFDLGSPGNPTLYGTEAGLKQAVRVAHRAGLDYYLDLVWNHNGFADLGTSDGGHSFYDAGGYPGFNITLPQDIDGDFHGAFESGDLNGRLAGLIDIDHSTNYQMIRSPVDPGAANNIRAGTEPAFGRIANLPDPNNARFYPDRQLAPIMVFDPNTGEANIPVYPFNNASPLAGDAVAENALGYLMRNAQWLVQAIGVDGFRLDAEKHYEQWVLNYLDRAVYRSSLRTLLNGQPKHVFSFGEVFDGSDSFLQQFVRKNINPADPGRIGGNRDVLDFPLFFALKANLTSNGLANDWRNVADATFDLNDDGQHDGSQGVMFVQSHDEFGPDLGNVAHAYVLMHPGNALVYFNGKEFGDGRDFPKDGRGDALGGLYGDALTKLVQIRDSHGRGNYIERWREKELFAYERDRSALVLLSNRTDAGFDSRTLQTNFPAGTRLVELTGNASDPETDPFGDFSSTLVVGGDGTVNVRFSRNRAPDGDFTGKGYLIYGVATPRGTLELTNVTDTLEGGTPTAGTNGTTRLADVDVVSADSFQVRLQTVPVLLQGGTYNDTEAGGDNALLRIDGGRDVNGTGGVDYTTPGGTSYGFEEFVTYHSPLWGGGDGLYTQTINTTGLSEGYHFITARAYRRRASGAGSAVFTDFRRTIYLDRLPADSEAESFDPITPGVNENRRLAVRSLDNTADNIHVFFDQPAALSDAQVLSLVGGGSQTNQIDRDLFTKDATGLTHGNHVATIVTYEISGRATIERVPGLFTSTIFGAGLGDVNFDGQYTSADVSAFAALLDSNNAQFNPAADLNGDGLIDDADLALLGDRLEAVGASPLVTHEYDALLAQFDGTALGNLVWNDLNRNGVQDFGEPGLPGVAVRLLDSVPQIVAATTTDADGKFGFAGISEGNYSIEVVPPAGFDFSLMFQGGSSALDSDVQPATGRTNSFVWLSGSHDVTRDAGLADRLPSADIVDVTPDPRTAPVDAVVIAFSEPVSGFDLADLLLSRGGGANLLDGSQTLSTSDNVAFTLGNLAAVTATPGSYLLSLTAAGAGIVDLAGGALAAGVSDSFQVGAAVAGRAVFYNNSAFDGNNPAANAADDAAIASDKSALLPGGTATLVNYTSYSKGINGLLIDVLGLSGTPTPIDFGFRTGNTNTPASWGTLATAPAISVRAGAGAGGSDRVTLTWPDGTILRRWLEVTILPTARTGLATADVFYFGNAVGESGNSTADAVVNATDEIGARTHPVGPFPTAAVTNLYDFNRDRLVNATDQIIARTNGTNPLTALRLISVPAESGGGAAAAGDELAGLGEALELLVARRRRR